MSNKKPYASRLTKDMLIKSGIEYISEDGAVFKNGKQMKLSINPGGYFILCLPEVDSDGNYIKIPITRIFKNCKKPVNTYTFKYYTVGLHRAMWAWHSKEHEVPEGYVVDHKNNKHDSIEDYRWNDDPEKCNLQLLTQAQNILKERGESNRLVKCRLNKPLSFYLDKLDEYLREYEIAKKEHNANKCHYLRTYISTTKAKIRYYELHKAESEAKAKQLSAEEVEKIHWHEIVQMKKHVRYLAKLKYEEGDKIGWHNLIAFLKNYKDTPEEYATLLSLEQAYNKHWNAFAGE